MLKYSEENLEDLEEQQQEGKEEWKFGLNGFITEWKFTVRLQH